MYKLLLGFERFGQLIQQLLISSKNSFQSNLINVKVFQS